MKLTQKFTLCKKQYVYLALAVLSIALAITTRVFAQEAVPATNSFPDAPPNGAPVVQNPGTREERAVENAEVRQELKEERKEEPRTQLSPRAQDRFFNLAKNTIRKMNAVVERFENIAGRLEARIGILKDKGVDTKESEEALQTARRSIALAKSMIAGLEKAVTDALTSDAPQQAFKDVRTRFVTVKEALKDAHTYLRTAVVSLRRNTEKPEGNGTTTNPKPPTPPTAVTPQ